MNKFIKRKKKRNRRKRELRIEMKRGHVIQEPVFGNSNSNNRSYPPDIFEKTIHFLHNWAGECHGEICHPTR